MLSVIYAECATCKPHMLSGIMLNVVMMSVVAPFYLHKWHLT